MRAGCLAHARRKSIEAEKAPEIAREVVELVRALYAVEHRAKALPAAERLALRRAQSAPVLAGLHDRLLAWKQQLLPEHPVAEAVNYALNQWEELTVFCSDGAVPIDDNVSEREMKRVVLNRRNSLFVGNARRPHGGDSDEHHQQLPPARRGPATLPDAVAGEPARDAIERVAGVAAG